MADSDWDLPSPYIHRVTVTEAAMDAFGHANNARYLENRCHPRRSSRGELKTHNFRQRPEYSHAIADPAELVAAFGAQAPVRLRDPDGAVQLVADMDMAQIIRLGTDDGDAAILVSAGLH